MTKKAYTSADGTAAKELAARVALTFTFDDGSTQTFDPTKCDENTRLAAMWHGFSQKIGDSYAGAAKAENSLAYAKEAVKDTIAQLYRNDWRATSESGPRISDLALAIARASGQTIEESHALVEGMDDDQKKAWRAKKKVAAALAQIQAEKAAEKAKRLAEKAAKTSAADTDDEEEEDLSFTPPAKTGEQPTA